MPNYWIIVGSPDNFEKTKELGFSVQGMKTRQRRKAERMEAGDQFVWYITGDQAFAGYATITPLSAVCEAGAVSLPEFAGRSAGA